jgi:predicted Fe-Mo cluster-binding NifX family protein
MKIAVPAFGTRVSPRFDCAPIILLVTVDDGKVVGQEELEANGWTSQARVGRLVELGVETVICGAIDWASAESLRAARVAVYCWVTGEVGDAVECLLRGELVSEAMTAPGGRCCGRWRFRARGEGDLARPPDCGPARGRGRHRRHGCRESDDGDLPARDIGGETQVEP